MNQETSVVIDPALVEKYIFELAAFGHYGETGVWRTVYSPEWVKAAACFEKWCADAGLEVRRDAVGNIWAKLEGSEGGPSIVTGSHIDTQKPGGRYDGALGAIGGLIALKSLREQYGQPRRTLEVLALCEEESSRFPKACQWASRAITGTVAEGEAEAMLGYEGETMAEAMRAVGLDPALVPTAKRTDIDTFIELHIEQGPILEHGDYAVGIVNAITGPRAYRVKLTGECNHAGAFPMDLRRDPMACFAEMAGGLLGIADRMGRPAVSTIGRIAATPNFPAIIPLDVEFTLDTRHPDPAKRQQLYAEQEKLMRDVAGRRGIKVEWEVLSEREPCVSDPGLVDTLERVAAREGIRTLTMASGAAHDTQTMALMSKVAMIFIRSKDGRSHTPEEFSSVDDMVAGIRLLTATLKELAY